MIRAAVYCEELKVMGEGGPKNNVHKRKKEEPSNIPKYYLITYNFLQTAGWTFLLFQLIQYYVSPNINKKISLYEHVAWTLNIFQNAAVLEVLHAAVKLVPSSPFVTLQQITSRVVLVCGVLFPFVLPRGSIGFPMMLAAWSITEIIRYSNYMLNLVNAVPQFLVWLRYSTFIILYPIGVTGELLCLHSAQKEAGDTGFWTIEMPNSYNVIFHYNHFLLFFMALYIPFFPKLYLHMVSQRKKVLGSQNKNGVHQKLK